MSVDHSSYRHVFNGGVVEVWYVAGVEVCADGLQAACSINIMRLIPFIATGLDRRLDRIGSSVAANAGAGNFRVGIYTNVGINFLYPEHLVVDSGDLTTTLIGIQAATINTVLVAGQLYWMAHVTSRAATFRVVNPDQLLNILGVSPTLPNDFNLGLSLPFTYGPLPDPFPVTTTPGLAVLSNPPIPAVAFRFTPL